MRHQRSLLWATILCLVSGFCFIICLAYQAKYSSTTSSTATTPPSRTHQQNDRVKAVPPQEAPNSNNEPNTATPPLSTTRQENDARFETVIMELRELMASTFDSNLRDPLMVACAEGDTSGVATMIKFLATQPKAFQRTILTRVDLNRRSALIHACRCSRNDTVAKDLLRIIQQQDQETQKTILTQQDINGDNALMNACKYHQKESVATSVIDAIKQQDKQTQNAILTSTKGNKDTCLCAHVARERGHENLAKAIEEAYNQLNKKQLKIIINDNVEVF